MGCQQKPDTSACAFSRELAEAFGTLVRQATAIGHELAGELGLTQSDLLGLYKLDDGISMKELANRMGCDASFITAVADNLESRGLAHREPSDRDRRVKNLVFTDKGNAVKERMMQELAVRMPWCYALDQAERRSFLDLLRKMASVAKEHTSVSAGGEAVTATAPVSSLRACEDRSPKS